LAFQRHNKPNYLVIGQIGYDVYVASRNNGTVLHISTTNSSTLEMYKLAASYSSAGVVFYLTGAMEQAKSSASSNLVVRLIAFFWLVATSQARTKCQALLFKTRLTNAQLAELTSL
jgi:hypothetical protein